MTIRGKHGSKQRSKQNQKEHIQLVVKPLKYALNCFSVCRDEKIRTSDLQHPMLARYRATLHPERGNKYNAIRGKLKSIIKMTQYRRD